MEREAEQRGSPKREVGQKQGAERKGFGGGKLEAIYLSSSSQPTKHSHRKVPKSCIPPSSGFQIGTPRPGEKGLTVDHANIQVF